MTQIYEVFIWGVHVIFEECCISRKKIFFYKRTSRRQKGKITNKQYENKVELSKCDAKEVSVTNELRLENDNKSEPTNFLFSCLEKEQMFNSCWLPFLLSGLKGQWGEAWDGYRKLEFLRTESSLHMGVHHHDDHYPETVQGGCHSKRWGMVRRISILTWWKKILQVLY